MAKYHNHIALAKYQNEKKRILEMTRAERIQRIEHLEQHYKKLSDEIARYFKHPDDRANCPAKLVNHTIEGSQPEPDSD